jgi:hypothetical protein
MTTMVRYRQFYLGSNLGWRGRIGLVVSMAIALALAIALVVLALGLALVLIPIIVVGLLIAAWRLRAFRAALARAIDGAGPRQEHEEPRTIDTDYTVIEGSDRKSP